MKKILPIALLLLSALAGAQQAVMLSHSFCQPVLYNPAFAGATGGFNVMLVHHSQWSGFKGAPRYNLFSLDKDFNDKKMGLGVNMISDKKGINNKLGGNVFYSYKIKINEGSRLALGISAGVFNQSLDFTNVVMETASDATFFSAPRQQMTYDANAGLAFISKSFEMGFAAMQLSGNKTSYSDANAAVSHTNAKHFLGSAKYKIFLSEEKDVWLAPQGLVRFVSNSPLQYDGNMTLEWADKFWFGATYKNDYAIALNAGFCIQKQFYIGYAYDLIIGKIGSGAGMSHEIMLNLQLGKNKKPKVKPAPEAVQAEVPPAEEPEPEKAPEPKPEPKPEVPAVIVNTSEKKWDTLEAKRNEKILKEKEKENIPPVKKAVEKPVVAEAPTASTAIWMSTEKAANFKDHMDKVPATGYYVVVKSFHTRDFALTETKRLRSSNYPEANWIYFIPKNFTYVFIKRVNTRQEATILANDVKSSGINDAWIQRIIE